MTVRCRRAPEYTDCCKLLDTPNCGRAFRGRFGGPSRSSHKMRRAGPAKRPLHNRPGWGRFSEGRGDGTVMIDECHEGGYLRAVRRMR